MNLSGVLLAMIEGLYRDKSNTTLPAAFGVSPLYGTDSSAGQFLAMKTDNRFDSRKDFGKKSSASSEFLRSNMETERIEVQLESHKAGYMVLPQSVISATSLSTDIVEHAVNAQIDQIYGGYIAEFLEVAGNDLPSAGGSFNISVPSASVVQTILGYNRAIWLASNKKPNTIWMSQQAFDAFMLCDEIQNGVAISGYTTTGSSVRRTGSAVPAQVDEFFRTRFGLTLFVEDRTILDSTGSSAYAAGDKMIIAHTASGAGDGALKTFHQSTYGGSADLVNFLVDNAAAPLPVGQVVRAEAVYAVKATNPNAGLFIDLTLP